jgi:hypothetical protein
MLTLEIQTDLATYAANKADILGRQLADRLATYGNDTSPPAVGAIAQRVDAQQRAEAEDTRARQQRWLAVARVAKSRGLVLASDEVIGAADVTLDPIYARYLGQAQPAGLVTDHL